MTDFADDSNISLNAFDEQNADKNALNGKNGSNEYNDNDMTNDSKTDEESDARDDNRDKSGSVPNKSNDDEDRYRFDTGSHLSSNSLLFLCIKTTIYLNFI